MTRDKSFKTLVRQRQSRTGEPYTAARTGLRSGAADDDRLRPRIVGLETKYSVAVEPDDAGAPASSAAEYLFRRVVAYGRSPNVFLENGARLCLDADSQPKYATPECDSVRGLVAHARAGDVVLARLAAGAATRLPEDIRVIVRGDGESHESYLVRSGADFARYASLMPFFVTRQCFAGAGTVLQTSRGTLDCLSRRSADVWSPRLVVTTHDAPHADPDRFRRLHVTIGDANVSETATFLRVATTLVPLQLVDDGVRLPDVRLKNPVRAIREISHDTSLRRTVTTASGGRLTATQIQREYLAAAQRHAGALSDELAAAVEMWDEVLTGLQRDPASLRRKVDWVYKLGSVDDYDDVSRRPADLDTVVTPDEIDAATRDAPETTRAHLRAAFIRAAREHGRDFTVDWTHLKLNDQPRRTIVCRDPYAFEDERVERLIASIRDRA